MQDLVIGLAIVIVVCGGLGLLVEYSTHAWIKSINKQTLEWKAELDRTRKFCDKPYK